MSKINVKINNGIKVINYKLANKNSLYYRDLLEKEFKKTQTNPSLDELIVIEFIMPNSDPKYTLTQNIIGCWNS